MLSWHCVGTKCEQLCWNNHHGHSTIKLSCLPRGMQLEIENLSVMNGSMVQFRANSLSFTHTALCDFNLSIVTGKSIATEGMGGGWFIFPSCCCRATAYLPCQQLCFIYTVETGRKRGKTPPNKQDVGLPGIIIACWACQYNAICSLLSRVSRDSSILCPKQLLLPRSMCKPPSFCRAAKPDEGFNQGRVNRSHSHTWLKCLCSSHQTVIRAAVSILPPLCHSK